MRNLIRIAVGFSVGSLLGACAVTTSYFPPSTPSKGEVVTASLSHFSVFFLNAFKDTDRLTAELSESCPGGNVEGITVTQVNRFWHIFGVHYDVKATGRCVK